MESDIVCVRTIGTHQCVIPADVYNLMVNWQRV